MNIPTKIFIVPYRNRECHKIHFEIYMKYILEDIPKNEYEIYFVHQCDTRPFNRGGIKNIGFLAIKKKYPNDYKNMTFIFNDIDTMPAKKNILNYDTIPGIIKHYYGFTFALGGIFSINGKDFENIGGFPNFWGWGLEDNNINSKAIKNGLIIDRKNFFKIHDNNIIQINDDIYKLISKQEAWRLHTTDIDDITDIKNLNYNVDNEFINVEHFDTKHEPLSDDIYNKKYGTILVKEPKYNPSYPKNFTKLW